MVDIVTEELYEPPFQIIEYSKSAAFIKCWKEKVLLTSPFNADAVSRPDFPVYSHQRLQGYGIC